MTNKRVLSIFLNLFVYNLCLGQNGDTIVFTKKNPLGPELSQTITVLPNDVNYFIVDISSQKEIKVKYLGKWYNLLEGNTNIESFMSKNRNNIHNGMIIILGPTTASYPETKEVIEAMKKNDYLVFHIGKRI